MRISDWSSDVCSSDLLVDAGPAQCQQLPFEQAAAGQLDQALGAAFGQRQQPAALSGTENQRLHAGTCAVLSIFHSFGASFLWRSAAACRHLNVTFYGAAGNAARRRDSSGAAIADDPELGTTHAVAGARQRTLLLPRATALVEHLADQRLVANHFDTRPGRALTFEHETLDRQIGRANV